MNELQINLLSFPDWGYVIYRTTYTAESNTTFPHAIRYIEACLKDELFYPGPQKAQPGYDNNSLRQVWSKYQSTIIEDPTQFDGVSLETVRAHFEAWVDSQGKRDRFNKYRVCLIVDEESLQTLKNAPVENVGDDDEELRIVIALEAFRIMDSLDTFPGWMKCWTHTLWFLWENMGDGDEMRRLYDSIDDSPIEGVFCG
jgi:hypothetical protein